MGFLERKRKYGNIFNSYENLMVVRKIWIVLVIENYFIIDIGIKVVFSDKLKFKFSNLNFFLI